MVPQLERQLGAALVLGQVHDLIGKGQEEFS